jgi:hypothetical protein
MKKDAMKETSSTHDGNEKSLQNFISKAGRLRDIWDA